jgi:hypothetical protein
MVMSSRVLNHPLPAALATLRDMLSRLPSEFVQQQPDMISRARATADLLHERMSDPAVVAISDAALSNGHSWTQVLINELQTAINQNNPAMLTTGNFLANLDAMSQNIGQFPMSQPTDAMNTLVEEAQRRLEIMQKAQIQQEELLRSLRDQQARTFAETQEAKEQGLKRLGEQETAAGKLLAALGAEGTSSGYGTTAATERAQADFWRWVTFAGGIVASILGVTLFLRVSDKDVASVAARAAITLPVVLLTVYAGRQSAGHRSQEREAKRLQLAFGSVDAYLADLDASKRAELKGNLTADLYSASRRDGAPEDYPSSSDLVDLLKEAVKRR